MTSDSDSSREIFDYNSNYQKRIDCINQGIDHLEHESDRGVILIVGAMMDELLAELLRNVLAPNLVDDLLNGSNAPIGSFSARIKVTRALGIIDEQDYKDIEIVRKIRNQAAHFDRKRGFETGFSSQSVSDLCKNLSQNMLGDDATTRQGFVFSSKIICGSLLKQVVMAQIVNEMKGHFTALRVVQSSAEHFFYHGEDI